MSSHFVSPSTFGLFILTIYIFTTPHSVVAQNNLINFICRRITSPEHCRSVMYSSPKSIGAKIDDVGHIAIDLATGNTSAAISHISQELLVVSNLHEKLLLRRCRVRFEAVETNLSRARTLWEGWQLIEARDAARAGIDAVNACRLQYANGEFPSAGHCHIVEFLLQIFVATCDVAGMNHDDSQYLSKTN